MRISKIKMLSIAFSFLFFATPVAYSEIIYSDQGESAAEMVDDNSYTYSNFDPIPQKEFQYAEEEEWNDNYYDNRYASNEYYERKPHHKNRPKGKSSRLAGQISPPGEKVIIVDPNVHAWGAYNAEGQLLRSGLATAGGKWCRDIKRPCRTSAGTFRIKSLGSSSCRSTKYPLGKGGAPMPYCMFFNGHQGLHGSYEVVAGNVSHGCVRMHVEDAEWVRFNFATIGTKVIVRPY